MNYRFETGGALSPWDQREWLLTDGSGSFAMGTVAGVATRRYHGLLVAAMHPPLDRVHLVSRVGEVLVLDGQSSVHELATCLFSDGSGGADVRAGGGGGVADGGGDGGGAGRGTVVHPRGYRHLRSFELTTGVEGVKAARWTYVVDGVTVDKTLTLPGAASETEGGVSAVLRYDVRFDAGRWVELLLLPMLSLRGFHALRRCPRAVAGAGAADDASRPGSRCGPIRVRPDASGVEVWAEDAPGGSVGGAAGGAVGGVGVVIRAQGKALEGVGGLAGAEVAFEHEPDWWYGHVYPVETERGLDDTEDLFKPGVFRARLATSGSVELHMTATPTPAVRRQRISAPTVPPGASVTLQRLMHATTDYLVWRRRPDGPWGTSVLAGFPWFGDWGRDTLVSLPGLLLETGRLAEAADVLRLYARHVDRGMVPNRFIEETNSPEYNTVDASLWFIHAVFAFREAVAGRGGAATWSTVFDDELLPACRAIVEGYARGTRYGIRMDGRDGLVMQGDAETQLTWMDAKCDGVAFTPRHGKPVEINALWYHALRCLGEDALAERAAASFRRLFWISPQRGLADVVPASANGAAGGVAGDAGSAAAGAGGGGLAAGESRDTRCRPNQIFAVSLPHSPLTAEQQRAVVEVVRRELLTPYGLRTLSPSERQYRPTYGGPPAVRDASYHNGTVWPWLMGPFLDAYLRVSGDTREAREEARRMLRPLLSTLETGCIGQIAEIFEGQPPHREVGAPAQAWSVAEVLRLAQRLGV